MRRLRSIGFGLGIVALTVGVIAGVVTAVQHIPRPAKKIEWVQRADAIIVQMTEVPSPFGAQLVRGAGPIPSFTLYGDGTLILAAPSERSGLLRTPLREASLSTGDIRSLLEFLDGQGFFEFAYEQPRGGGADLSTTYLYASTKTKANAISVYGVTAPEPSGDAQFRKLQKIRQRVDDLAVDAAKTSPTFTPDEVELFVQRGTTGASDQPDWPIERIDLAAIAPESGIGELPIRGDEIPLVLENLTTAIPANGGYVQGGRRYLVWYRPVLPYEENFPEFDTTQ